MIVDGTYDHSQVQKSGTILGKVAKYSLFVIFIFIVILYLVYSSTKRIKIAKKIKKEDKMWAKNYRKHDFTNVH